MMSRKGLSVFRLSWAAFVVGVTSAPYIINWHSTPAGFHYTWIVPPYPEDSFGYMAWAEQAARGAWLFKIKYTALSHAPFLFHPFFLICGWVSALFSCDIGIVFWIAKAAGVMLFFIVLYRYLDFLGLNPMESIAASVLVGISSGIGATLIALGWIGPASTISADLWMPEISTFWSFLWNPLFPFSLTLLLLSVYWADRGTREKCFSDLWLSGLATGVMALVHPYSVPLVVIFATIVIVARMRMSALAFLARYFTAALPFVAYVILISELNPLVARHNALGEMKSPNVAAYILGFGFPLIFFILGLVIEKGQLARQRWTLVIWFFIALFFAYLPFWFQRKLIFGAHIPLSIFGGISVAAIYGRWLIGRPRWLSLGAIFLMAILIAATPVYLLVRQNAEVRSNPTGAYFVSEDVIEGLRILRHRSKPDDIVLGSFETSRLIPAFSGNTVLWGHWAMSLDSEYRRDWIAGFFKPQSNWDDGQRATQFWGSGIRFIFGDGSIKKSLEENPWVWKTILRNATKIFENRSVVIYQYRDS